MPWQSHPPLRPLPGPSDRPPARGPARFVDPVGGDDASAGSEEHPWLTINHACRELGPGDTLYLRGGTYHENVYCSVVGTEDAPVTIRSCPGELAVLDGGIAEFQNHPQTAWVADPDGADGEYVSACAYRNLRDVVGMFGDSHVGLQTYWYLMDLRATNELCIADDELMFRPVYCGPGLWYDKRTGRIHVRLAHTSTDLPAEAGHSVINYRGETDPRRLPLVIAPFNSTPLIVDQAMHVCFQDLVVRGGGYVTVALRFGVGIEFENCRIYCGTYGLSAKNTGPLKMTHCGVHGTMQPWTFRSDTALYSYDGRVYPPFVGGNRVSPEMGRADRKMEQRAVRHVSRMTTHAVLITEGGHEFDVFYYPLNHDWDISYCEFTDGHDGVYLSGRHIRFHHNWVANMNDDGIYLSSPTPGVTDSLYVYQNLISTVVVPLGLHGRGGPGGDIYVYRNIVDQRGPIQYERPTPDMPAGHIMNGTTTLLRHGSVIHMERMHFYQNTILQPVFGPHGQFAGGMLDAHPEVARRVFNNLYIYYPSPQLDTEFDGYPTLGDVADNPELEADGNLHWHIEKGAEATAGVLASVRNHRQSLANQAGGATGWATRSLVADPMLVHLDRARDADNDYRLQPDSPAIGQGVVLGQDMPDPMRPDDGRRPDIGALPLGAKPLRVGIHARITAGTVASLGQLARIDGS